MTRRLGALAAAAVTAAAVLTGTLSAGSADAASVYYYKTWRTDGTLAEQFTPTPGNVVGWIYGNGTTVGIVCQVWSEGTVDGLPYHVWDQLQNGSYVYDYYITTPAPDGQFTTSIPRCQVGD
ncbi:hypothetical protein AB0L59_38790 [Streptomyces sp. NPDC052109]|uniref:hypothetical protein n=1 Tax=Streptomyces sp. NPDC052109 TaxID=3155527 RepID=UPI003441BAF2